MKKLFCSFSCFLLISCLTIGGCQGGDLASSSDPAAVSPDSLRILTIGTADSGGTMYPVGKAIAQAIEDSDSQIRVNINASIGSSANVRSIESGDIDLGLVSGDVAFAAVSGTGEFTGDPVEELRVLAAVYPSLSNWMALSSSGITYVHDLAGMRIGIGPQDSTTEIASTVALSAIGIDASNSSLINCGLGSGAEDVLNHTLDAVHGFTGVPINSMAELAQKESCVLLRYTSAELRAIIRSNPFYYQDIIPAGTYEGQETDVDTFGIKCLLCVSADMDEELAYELTALLYENADALGQEHASLLAMGKEGFMYDSLPISLHPGAERFYREKHLLPTAH